MPSEVCSVTNFKGELNMQSVQELDSIRSYPLPPRASGLPLIGSIPNVIRYQGDYFMQAWKKHGDIYTMSLGPLELVIMNHPDYAQHILRDNVRNYVKGGALNEAARGMLGNGLVTSEGDYWRKQRRLMQPQFHRQYLASITDLMTEAIEEIMGSWDSLVASGEAQNVSKLFAEITMNVIMKTMFGRSIDPEEMKLASEAFTYSLRYLTQDAVTGKFPEWVPVPGRKQYHASLAKIDEFVYGIIKQRRENPSDSHDIISMMLQMVDEETNEAMSDKEIRDEVVTIFLAGYETTALAMSWGTYRLAQEQAIQDTLIQHIDEALEGRAAQFEDLRTLDYSRMVISEILRLYPPAIFITRMAAEDDVVGGYLIKAGQAIIVNPMPIHYHPDFWSNPETFDPERFRPEAEKGRHSLAWIPFGAGQRQCIGKDFAMMEATLILSRLLQRYRIMPADKPAPKAAFSATLSPTNGVWVKLEKR
jgi:cytochrome P450